MTQNVDGLHQSGGSSRVLELHGNETSAICLDCGKGTPFTEIFAPGAKRGSGQQLRAQLMKLQKKCRDAQSTSSSSSDSDSDDDMPGPLTESEEKLRELKRKLQEEKLKELKDEIKEASAAMKIPKDPIGQPDDVQVPQSVPICACGGMLRPAGLYFGEPLDPKVLRAAVASAVNSRVFLVAGTSAAVAPAAELPVIARRYGAKIIEVNTKTTLMSKRSHLCLNGPSGIIFPALFARVKQRLKASEFLTGPH